MGVFACGWLGWVFALSGCVRVGVCVLACVRSLGGGGTVWSRRLCPGLLGWCSRSGVGGFGVCAVACARWADGGNVGAGHDCPAPYIVACAARLLRGAQEKGWGCSHGVLTRAHTRREMGEEGEPSWGGPWWSGRGLAGGGALGGNTRWWRQVPKAEGEQN